MSSASKMQVSVNILICLKGLIRQRFACNPAVRSIMQRHEAE